MIIDAYNALWDWWDGILAMISFPVMVVAFFVISFALMYLFMVNNIKNGRSVWGGDLWKEETWVETLAAPFGLSIILLLILSFWPLVLAAVVAISPIALVVYLLQKLAKLTAERG